MSDQMPDTTSTTTTTDDETTPEVGAEAKSLAELITGEMEKRTAAAAESSTAEAEAEEAAEPEAEAEESAESEAESELTELQQLIEELGLDLGVTPEELSPELRPVYETVVRKAAETVREAVERQVAARRAMETLQEFQQKLEQAPDKVLLTLAVSYPDIFKQVTETVQMMEQDPKVKDLVIRELQSEARLREAERRERSLVERDVLLKAQRMTQATRRAAARYGVNPQIAEEVVASVIQRVGDIDLADAEEIVKELAPKPKKQPTVTKKPVPKQAAPATSLAAAAAGASSKPEAKPQESPSASTGSLRDIVGNAIRRVTAKL